MSPTSAAAEQTLRLLWRHHDRATDGPGRQRRGPQPTIDLDTLVRRAIGIADADGLAGLSMRRLADGLGVSRMAAYTYIATRDQLVELMADQCFGEMTHPTAGDWRTAVRAVADANLELYTAHPWLLEVPQERPVLGPGVTGTYERELAALQGLGVSDVELDRCLSYLLNFVRGIAADRAAAARLATSDTSTSEWWQTYGELLGRYVTEVDYPLATRVGAAAGSAQGSAYDPEVAYAFGLDRILAGFDDLVRLRERPVPEN